MLLRLLWVMLTRLVQGIATRRRQGLIRVGWLARVVCLPSNGIDNRLGLLCIDSLRTDERKRPLPGIQTILLF